MSRPSIYTDDFLLWVIRDAYGDTDGKLTIEWDTPLRTLYKYDTPDSDRFDDVLHALYELFQKHADLLDFELWPPKNLKTPIEIDRWEREVASRHTVGVMIENYRRCSELSSLSFAPLELPGATGCEAAGVFLGLQQLLEAGGKRVAPSTRIQAVLRGPEQRDLARHLSWLTRHVFPFQDTPRWTLGTSLIAIAILTGLTAIVFEVQQPGAGSLLVLLLWSFKFLGAGRWLQRTSRFFPRHVVTFGDLAHWLQHRLPPAVIAPIE